MGTNHTNLVVLIFTVFSVNRVLGDNPALNSKFISASNDLPDRIAINIHRTLINDNRHLERRIAPFQINNKIQNDWLIIANKLSEYYEDRKTINNSLNPSFVYEYRIVESKDKRTKIVVPNANAQGRLCCPIASSNILNKGEKSKIFDTSEKISWFASTNTLEHTSQVNNDILSTKKYYEEALKVTLQLADKNPDMYLPDVITTLNNLGKIPSSNNEINDSKNYFEKALKIAREAAKKDPNKYLPIIVMALNNLGKLSRTDNNISEAKKYYEESLQIKRLLAEKTPDKYLPSIAVTLNNLGVLSANNNISEAKKYYEESLQIRRLLAEKMPNIYLPDLAITLNNSGILLRGNNEILLAKKQYEEALQIYKKLSEKNPDTYLPDIAITMNNLGALLSTNNELLNAKLQYEQALQIYRNLAVKSPDIYLLDIAMTDINLGSLYKVLIKETGNMQLKLQGLALMKDANRSISTLSKENPLVIEYKQDINKLTSFFEEFNESSLLFYKKMKAIESLEMFNEIEKDIYQKIIRQNEIIGILIETEKEHPNDAESEKLIAEKYGNLSWHQLFDKQFEAAEQSARKGLQIDKDAKWINANLALSLLFQGRWEETKAIYSKLNDVPYDKGTYRDTFLEDLDALEREGITHPDVVKAREFLIKK